MTSGRVSRRVLLGSAAVTAGGVALAATQFPRERESASAGRDTEPIVDFHGHRQAGIETPPQAHALFAAFDLADVGTTGLADLLTDWTTVAAALSRGEPSPPHPRFTDFDPTTDLATGLGPSRLTVTFGLGPSLFDQHSGSLGGRPRRLRPLPHFAGDQLRPEWTGGDLLVQICADDRQVVSQAFRALRARTPGLATLRWNDIGFLSDPPGTPRTILGHKDGTANPAPGSRALSSAVWTTDVDGEPDWFTGGTYLAFRKIRTRLAEWDLTARDAQDQIIGRRRGDGAPLGGARESDEPDLAARDSSGDLVIPDDAHIRRVASIPMLRRGYSFDYGLQPTTAAGHHPDHEHSHGHGVPAHDDDNHDRFDAGLLFAAFVRTPDAFIRAQQQMTEGDALHRFLEHTGGGLFAVPPGVAEGESIAAGLLT